MLQLALFSPALWPSAALSVQMSLNCLMDCFLLFSQFFPSELPFFNGELLGCSYSLKLPSFSLLSFAIFSMRLPQINLPVHLLMFFISAILFLISKLSFLFFRYVSSVTSCPDRGCTCSLTSGKAPGRNVSLSVLLLCSCFPPSAFPPQSL